MGTTVKCVGAIGIPGLSNVAIFVFGLGFLFQKGAAFESVGGG